MSRSTSPDKNGNRVYVSGYSLKDTQEEIKEQFKQFGEIADFSWKGRFCFIAYEKAEDAQNAVKNSQEYNGRQLVVEIARARKKDGACYQCGKEGHLYYRSFKCSARSCRESRRSYSDERRKKKKKHRKHSSSSSSEKKKKKSKKRKRSSSSRSRSSD